MGSKEAVEPKAMPAAPAGAAVPGTPPLVAVPSASAEAAAPGTPKAGDTVDVGTAVPSLEGIQQEGSPSQQAAMTPPASPKEEVTDEIAERLAKKARRDEDRQEMKLAVKQFLQMSKTLEIASQALHATNEQLTVQQKELERLSSQLGLDQASARWQLATLQTFCNKVESIEWQVSGGKRNQHPTMKDSVNSMTKEIKSLYAILSETKKENRAQADLLLTHVKSMEEAFKNVATGLANMSVVMNPPVGTAAGDGATGTAAPVATAAAPPPVATAAAPAPMPTAAVPTSMATPSTPAPMATPSSSVGEFPVFPPMFGAPPPPRAYPMPPATRAGRLRVTNSDGSQTARAVSPQGRPPSTVTTEWANEFGLGTLNFNGAVYRVLPDSYLQGSFPLN